MKPSDKAIEAGVKLCWDCPRATPSMIRDILTAAYAAQFPPGEDYAELIDGLREWAGQYEGITLAGEEIIGQAADAIEAVVAERNSFTAAVLLSERQNDILTGDIASLRAERDALLARLAPVDDKELVEIAAKEMQSAELAYMPAAAIAAIRPHIEAAERERCAKIAEKYENERANYLLDRSARAVATLWREEIAAAIRSGK